ncbi:MAG TPA: helix-turn-helix domain-containing protein [Solirubrobacteraceae bacterium]|jgi:AcrR family transcriptional regulator|nr:helix-turn-helix domain-containing protein [Solirubrobacteraceae bacterium]
MSTTERPLRRDAERNRMRILEAAAELFTERGLDVTLNDIAHHAGVGVGTVYRRFPDKEQLIDALFEERLGQLVELADLAQRDPDPMSGLRGFLERALELQAADRGLKELLLATSRGREQIGRLRGAIVPRVGEVVERARAAGMLRPDIASTDMPIVQLMVGAVIDCCRDLEPELWRRYLAIVLDGMTADPADREPLAVPSVTHDQLDAVMAAWRPPRRS